MQRRTIGLVLLGIGAFAVVGAVAVRFVLAPQLITLPLDQEGNSVATGTGLTVFYPGRLEERDGVAVRSGRTVIGDPKAPEAGADVAVWTATAATTDESGGLIAVTEDRLCLDRRTAEAAQPCPSERLNGDNRVRHAGLSLTFPFGIEQRDYEYFDTTVKRTFPARFDGEEQVVGLDVYRFEQNVPETVIAQTEVPGQLAGGSEGTEVLADRVYSNVRTLWVEPTSGVIVKGQEAVRQVLRGPDGATGVTLLEGTLVWDESTVTTAAGRAADAKSRITLLSLVGPLVLGGIGLLALVGGALLVRGGSTRRGGHAAAGQTPTEHARSASSAD